MQDHVQDAARDAARDALAKDLEDLAAWISSNPVPLPIMPRLSAHVIDHHAARRTAEQLGMEAAPRDPRSEYLTWERWFGGQVRYVIQTTVPLEELALVSGLERVLGRGLTAEERERALQDYRPSGDLPDGEPDEPTDEQLANRYGVEGGIPYAVGDTRDEHDPSL